MMGGVEAWEHLGGGVLGAFGAVEREDGDLDGIALGRARNGDGKDGAKVPVVIVAGDAVIGGALAVFWSKAVEHRGGSAGLGIKSNLEGDRAGVGQELDADAGRGRSHLAEEPRVPGVDARERTNLGLCEAPGAMPPLRLERRSQIAMEQRVRRALRKGGAGPGIKDQFLE